MSVEILRGRVLIAEDEAHQRLALASMLTGWGYETRAAANGQEALRELEEFPADVIVTDLMMPVMDGPTLLARLRDTPGAPPAIVLTAFGNIETAVRTVLDLGAFWFLEKPLQPEALRLLLTRAAAHRRLEAYSARLEQELTERGALGDLVGGSPAMQQVFSLIRQVAPTQATVLITGDSGTGKELAARAIHQLSRRKDGPFLALNCGALPETLIESSLFGHEKGAYTGALERRAGCFELANGGTLLLDEIGEMPVVTQVKLLRVLEDRKVRRLGSSRETEVDVRVLASTNRRLEEAIRAGLFREDLYFRLNVFAVWLPPLRDRKDDIPAICTALMRDLNARHGCRATGIDPASLALLQQHDWPGNVRELRNYLERAVILAGEGPLEPHHFAGLPGAAPRRLSVIVPPAGAAATEPSVTLTVGTTVAEAERSLIELTLKHTGFHRGRSATLLGISPKTLFNKLREYGRETGPEESGGESEAAG